MAIARFLESYVLGPSGPTPSTLAQSKERKGSNFAIWQPCVKEMKYPEGGDSGQYLLQKPLIVNIGAILGSIGGYQGSDYGGFYPYRTSKAGMHMLTKVH